jgi:hypothetical protein
MRSRLAAGLLAAALCVSCSGIVDPSDNVTDTFSGTIPVQGTAIPGHFFKVSKTGEFTVKVTSMQPNSTLFFGTILSQGPTNGNCTGNLPILQQNSFSTVNTPALTGSIYSGNYCVFLFDIGTFSTAQTYTLTVSHPPA